MIPNIIFLLLLIATAILFARSIRTIIRNIKLGKASDISGESSMRWKTMFLVAIGQSKMTRKPIAGFLHVIVYLGFILVNIEMLEILIDGATGTHRVLSFMGDFYTVLVSGFEVFALAVIFACAIFLIRRNILKISRFHNPEMTSWPLLDANIILFTEILLMSAFLSMNAADGLLQARGAAHYTELGTFPISSLIQPLFAGLSDSSLVFIERSGWWFHIIGVFAFLNYVPYSKHFHILLAFPNVFYSKLKPKTYINNMASVTKEVQIAMGLADDDGADAPEAFGAKDVTDLPWKTLMDAYSCTECGRCTAVCPANLTGKKLSPRKVVMDTRDRLEEIGKHKAKNGADSVDEKMLLRNYVTEEELWACTTCNACATECPVNIDQPAIIMELRRYLFMEESAAPSPLNQMSTNIENNGAPWQYPAADRLKWADDLFISE